MALLAAGFLENDVEVLLLGFTDGIC